MRNFGSIINPSKYGFALICKANNLLLDYKLNKKEICVLRDIFEARSYADYFPFYRNVTVVDIGAHYGYFSLFAGKNTDPASLILAFEPEVNNYRALCSNLDSNKAGNIRPFNCAIGGVSEISKLYKGKSPNSSLLQNYALARNDLYTETETKTLSHVIRENNIQQIDFLKMDCEGSEYAILETMTDSVFDRIMTISMEFHDLKSATYNGQFITGILRKQHFDIVRYTYDRTSMGLNYGRIIATKFR